MYLRYLFPPQSEYEILVLENEKQPRKQATSKEQLGAAAAEIGLGRRVLLQPLAVKLKKAASRLLLFIYFLHTDYRCVQVITDSPHFSNCKHTG